MHAERVTSGNVNDQLLYFTSSSLRSDDRALYFISDRTGHPNIFVRDLVTGAERALTDNTVGVLKSYVYFDGIPYQGLGKASVSLHGPTGTVYYIYGREVRKILPDGKQVTLNRYPEGQMTAFTHVSTDGTRLCVPTTDARALDGEALLSGKPAYDIDHRVQTEGLASYLRVYDTATGAEVVCERVPRSWITHVQFAPNDNSRILYNHEWPADCGIRRMWLFDGHQHVRLRTEAGNRSRRDWTCHEMWERDGSAIIYHGSYAEGRSYIGRMQPGGAGLVEIPLPVGYRRYGHFTVGTPNVLVSDGYYEEPGDRETFGGDWISRIDVDWEGGTARWTPLCRNSSSWNSQDAHPHPIYDHQMKYVYFTSDTEGRRAVYRVRLSTGS